MRRAAPGQARAVRLPGRVALGRPSLPPEQPTGIGTRNEGSLHSDIRGWYALPGDEFEQPVEGYIVDIVRGDLLIEIQTGSFAAVRDKLRALAARHRVRLVHPIAKRKWVVRVSKSGKRLSRRRSPKSGSLFDLFAELVHLPDLVALPGFGVEVLMVEVEEARQERGRVLDRRLLEVVRRIDFTGPGDFLRLLPERLARPCCPGGRLRFTNKSLAAALDIPVWQAQQLTYCLRGMGAIREAGRRGRALLFET